MWRSAGGTLRWLMALALCASTTPRSERRDRASPWGLMPSARWKTREANGRPLSTSRLWRVGWLLPRRRFAARGLRGGANSPDLRTLLRGTPCVAAGRRPLIPPFASGSHPILRSSGLFGEASPTACWPRRPSARPAPTCCEAASGVQALPAVEHGTIRARRPWRIRLHCIPPARIAHAPGWRAQIFHALLRSAEPQQRAGVVAGWEGWGTHSPLRQGGSVGRAATTTGSEPRDGRSPDTSAEVGNPALIACGPARPGHRRLTRRRPPRSPGTRYRAVETVIEVVGAPARA